MEIQPFVDVSLFAGFVADFVAADPFSTNVISVQVARVISGLRVQGDTDRFLTAVDGDVVVGLAMFTPPYHAFISRMLEPAASALADWMIGAELEVAGVSGEIRAVEAFSEAWASRTAQSTITQTSMRFYRLDRLRIPDRVSGRDRVADQTNLDLVSGWERDFHAEAAPHQPVRDRTAELSRRIDAREITLWIDDGRPVAMAACSAAPAGVARVGPVFTPRPHRRRGYGSAATAAATRRALEAGAKHVALYTDLTNPTSNAIYQSIGFIADHDAEERRFEEPAQAGTSGRC